MMFEIEINGRLRTATVEPVDGASSRYRLTIDGVSREIDAVAVEDDTLSLIVPGGGASHEVGFCDGLLPAETIVYLHTGTLPAVVNGRRSRRGAQFSATGEQRIVAPMPGRVLRVLAAPGDEVAARQPLVVVEAMKMENELSSPRAGRVKEVMVTAGTSVEAGRLLAVVE